MTSHLNSHRTTVIKPEMLSGVQNGNGTSHDKYNIRGIAQTEKMKFSCKVYTLMKLTRRWTYFALRYCYMSISIIWTDLPCVGLAGVASPETGGAAARSTGAGGIATGATGAGGAVTGATGTGGVYTGATVTGATGAGGAVTGATGAGATVSEGTVAGGVVTGLIGARATVSGTPVQEH